LKTRGAIVRPSKATGRPPDRAAAESTNPQQSIEEIPEDALQTIEEIGGGGWTRTNDLRIMSSIPDSDSKQNQVLSSAESGQVGQNPQLRRNLNSIPEDDGKEQV